jgi:hypothetical protein
MRTVFFTLLVAANLFAQESGIQDNSFLIEEAYNQEQGVVQHILTHRTDWSANNDGTTAEAEFTQEWPVWGQAIQGSFTLPIKTPFQGADLHVRYQLLREAEQGVAFAPRFSFLLHYESDLDLKNMLGDQVNLPFSKELDGKHIVHANLGLTFDPPPPGGTPYCHAGTWTAHFGGSGIYAVRRNFHVLCEGLVFTPENSRPAYVVSPGVRYAVNMPGGAQWVLGIGAPMQFRSQVDFYGLFLYLSFEHSFVGKLNPAPAKLAHLQMQE